MTGTQAPQDHLGEALRPLLEDETCAVAESCTGGLVAQALCRVDGSSDWFRGAIVAYQSVVKFRLLGVTPGPVVNAHAAEEMVRGVAELFDSTLAISVTGAAGPEPQDGASPGTVFIATFVNGVVDSQEYHFDGAPVDVCDHAQKAALAQLISALESRPAGSTTSTSGTSERGVDR